MQFTNAIVRLPCKNMNAGLSASGLGIPDHSLALHQHGKYVEALRNCGLDVRILPADEDYPDSTFVEDTALLTPHVAIITNPGAPSRQGEVHSMQNVIKEYYDKIESIRVPGTLEAGDVMMTGGHYFIGLSERTNRIGAEQLKNILHSYDLTASVVDFSGMLHLKSGVSYLENNTMLLAEHLSGHPAFKNTRR